MIKIDFLQANHGDAIWLTFEDNCGKKRNIVIDGGPAKSYSFKDAKGKIQTGPFQQKIIELKEAPQNGIIDLLIITHVDDDHIGGVLKWIQKDLDSVKFIGKVWFNSGKILTNHFKKNEGFESGLKICLRNGNFTSVQQGIDFEKFLEENNIWYNKVVMSGQTHDIYGAKIEILTPTEDQLKHLNTKWQPKAGARKTSKSSDYHKTLTELMLDTTFQEDEAIFNGSSIAILLEYKRVKLLLLADSHPSKICAAIRALGYDDDNKLKVDLVKISHHGSQFNTSPELLSLLDTENFVITSDGKTHGLPDKKCIARIIRSKPNANILFNYPSLIAKIFSPLDYKDSKFATSAIKEIVLNHEPK